MYHVFVRKYTYIFNVLSLHTLVYHVVIHTYFYIFNLLFLHILTKQAIGKQDTY